MATPISDQKKRAFEALERRIAFDKAKGVQQEELKKKKSKRNPNDKQEALAADSQKVDYHAPLASLAKIAFSSPPPLKKGQVLFSGSTPRRETSGGGGEDVHPVYFEISQIVDETFAGTATMATSKDDVVNKIVLDLFQHGDKGRKWTKGSVATKIEDNILLDNFVPRDNSLKDARVEALQSQSKRSKNHMTMQQHRKCGSFNFPKEFHNFDLFKPMHEMWKEYIIKILKGNREKELPKTLLVADLHGSFLQVVECKITSFKGVRGITVRESAETVGLITEDNQFRVVPKRGSVFMFRADCWKITLHGDHLSLRNDAK